MASDPGFMQFVVDQIQGAGEISARKMFGEYAVYCNTKVVALICDNKLFVKPTEGGRQYIGTPVEAPAYPGAKPSFLIEDMLENRQWLTELIRITAAEVPEPKPKKRTAKPAAAPEPKRKERATQAVAKKPAAKPAAAPKSKKSVTKAKGRLKAGPRKSTVAPKKKTRKTVAAPTRKTTRRTRRPGNRPRR